MKRREFINWAGLGLIASYFPVALAACSNTETNVEQAGEKKRSLSIDTAAGLAESGYLLDEEAKVLVALNSEDRLIAVDPTCTHQGCTVEWFIEENRFICPCHNAKFAADGKVIAKSAPSPLGVYEVAENEGNIIVELAQSNSI